jgi:hypothetical protein
MANKPGKPGIPDYRIKKSVKGTDKVYRPDRDGPKLPGKPKPMPMKPVKPGKPKPGGGKVTLLPVNPGKGTSAQKRQKQLKTLEEQMKKRKKK